MSDRMLYIGGGIAVSAALVLAVYLRPLPEEPAPAAASAQPETETASVEPALQPDPVTAATAAAAETQPAPAPDPELPMQAPQLTDLRVEPDGAALIAGQAAPGAAVLMFLDGTEIDRVTADPSGAFLAFPVLEPSDRPRLLTLTAQLGETSRDGAETFAIAPFGMPEEPVVVAAEPATVDAEAEPVPEPEIEVAAAAAAEAAPAPDIPDVPEADEAEVQPELATQTGSEPEQEPLQEPATQVVVADQTSPPVLAISEDGVRVLSVPDAPAPEVMSTVALDTITYDGAGDVRLAGRAANTGFLRVYVDNSPVTALAVDAATGWEVALPEVDTGVYTLRIDEVNEDGEVLSRIETPFLREDPALVEEAFEESPTQNGGLSVAMRTVQPGNTLWAIAEERYGAGVLYVQVFQANADRIRNPDLIYPGQVFELPDLGQ